MSKQKVTTEELHAIWRDIKNIKHIANPSDATEVEVSSKKEAYKKARDAQYRKQFDESKPEYASQIDSNPRLKDLPIKRIIAPFHMCKFGKEHVAPLSILPYKPSTEEEFQNIFYYSQEKWQAATVLGALGFNLLITFALNISLIPKLSCVGLISAYAGYTIYNRNLERPSKYVYTPYTLEEIIDGVEEFNSSDRYDIRYPNCERKFSKHSKIMTALNKGGVANEK